MREIGVFAPEFHITLIIFKFVQGRCPKNRSKKCVIILSSEIVIIRLSVIDSLALRRHMNLYKDALNALVVAPLDAVDETSTPSYATIKELRDAGHVTALYSGADDGDSFMNIAITLRGRRFQSELNANA